MGEVFEVMGKAIELEDNKLIYFLADVIGSSDEQFIH